MNIVIVPIHVYRAIVFGCPQGAQKEKPRQIEEGQDAPEPKHSNYCSATPHTALNCVTRSGAVILMNGYCWAGPKSHPVDSLVLSSTGDMRSRKRVY